MKKILILGAGAWGTAVACLLADNGYEVFLWCHEQEVADSIQKNRVNERYLPGVLLSSAIRPVTSIKEAFAQTEWIFEAVPVQFLRSVLMQIKPYYDPQHIWVVMSKGIEQNTLMLPGQILDDVFQCKVRKAIFSGPSFAADLAKKHITGVTIAAESDDIIQLLRIMLTNNYFKPYTSFDVVGVQVGGALKNIIAIGIGILDGAGYTDNTKAFLFTRGLHELVELTTMIGGEKETIYGLSGVGDLALTAMGKLSRNMLMGQQLGKGISLSSIAEQWGTLPEGINTIQSVHQLAQKYGLSLPICHGLYAVIFQGKSVDQFLRDLIS